MRGLCLGLAILVCAPAVASQIDFENKLVTCKVVYYGSTATSLHDNLAYVYGQTSDPKDEGLLAEGIEQKRRKIAGSDDSYELLPLRLGELRGFGVRFHLYTVPTKPAHNATRVAVLKGTDAIVFVASNEAAELNATIASWQELKRNLAINAVAPGTIPIVVQLDHRTQANAIDLAKLREALGITVEPTFEAVAPSGVGVFATLKATAKLVLTALRDASKPAR